MPARASRVAARIAGPAALIAAFGLAIAIPAAAHAPARRRAISTPVHVTAMKVPASAYPGLTVTPAISTGPTHRGPVKVFYYVTVNVRVRYRVRVRVRRHHRYVYKYVYRHKLVPERKRRSKFVTRTLPSTQEWMVLSGDLQSDLVSVTPTGTITTLVPNLLPPGSVPEGQVNNLPSYGSVQVGGQVWLIDYSVTPATLYAVAANGDTVAAATVSGAITSFTAGPDSTLEVADNTGYLNRCAITVAPSAKCVQFKVPTIFDGGQIDALGQGGGRVYFTDDSGELASFNPANDTFAGPYGDIAQDGQRAGEASALPGTIVSTSNSRMYVAGGQDTNPLFQNNLIRLIDPRTGTLLRTYSRGLTNVVALTVGPDGNVWFLDETNSATGAGKVGVLNITSGLISQYAVPRGYRLPVTGPAIASGPAGSGTLFFNLQTISGGLPAFGEVSDTITPTTKRRRSAPRGLR